MINKISAILFTLINIFIIIFSLTSMSSEVCLASLVCKPGYACPSVQVDVPCDFTIEIILIVVLSIFSIGIPFFFWKKMRIRWLCAVINFIIIFAIYYMQEFDWGIGFVNFFNINID